MEAVTECLLDKRREIFKLGKIWDLGVQGESVKSKILGDLEGYWAMLAQQGRSLEEATR